MTSVKNIFGQIKSFWTGLSKKKKISFIVLISLLLVVTGVVVALLNRTDYTVLYTGLSEQEAGEIYTKLSESGTDVKVGSNGIILVPGHQEEQLRISLAAEGYPKTGLNYDIFKNSTGFGTTEFEKQKFMQFQLQDRLQETIKSMDLVEDAIVTLTLPDNNSVVLREDKRPSTASVLLKVKNNAKLSPHQVKAIIELVSKSVTGLTAENISVVDQNMQVLNGSENPDDSYAGNLLELERQVGASMEKQILNLLEPVFGYGKVVAGVNVRLDFDKVTKETVKFEPVVDDAGVAISLNQLEEITKQKGSGGATGQDSNGGAPVYVSEENDDEVYEKISKVVNYEVNQTRELIEKAQGNVEHLTVSVVIDQEEDYHVIQQVKQVVSGAIGVEPDSVVVHAMKFNGLKEMEDAFNVAKPVEDGARSLNKTILIYVLASLALILLFLVVLKLISRKKPVYVTEKEEVIEKEKPQVKPNVMPVGKVESYKESIENFYKDNRDVVIQLVKNGINEDRGEI